MRERTQFTASDLSRQSLHRSKGDASTIGSNSSSSTADSGSTNNIDQQLERLKIDLTYDRSFEESVEHFVEVADLAKELIELYVKEVITAATLPILSAEADKNEEWIESDATLASLRIVGNNTAILLDECVSKRTEANEGQDLDVDHTSAVSGATEEIVRSMQDSFSSSAVEAFDDALSKYRDLIQLRKHARGIRQDFGPRAVHKDCGSNGLQNEAGKDEASHDRSQSGVPTTTQIDAIRKEYDGSKALFDGVDSTNEKLESVLSGAWEFDQEMKGNRADRGPGAEACKHLGNAVHYRRSATTKLQRKIIALQTLHRAAKVTQGKEGHPQERVGDALSTMADDVGARRRAFIEAGRTLAGLRVAADKRFPGILNQVDTDAKLLDAICDGEIHA